MTRSTTSSRTRGLTAQFAAPLRAYLRTETGGAGLLLAATVLALLWANSPLGDTYTQVWGLELAVEAGDVAYREDLRHWVNDGLMVFFFFVVGLELRRQLSMGELTDRRRVTVPVLGAVAGLAVPAAIYLAFNPTGEAARGWGVAMATDTAFVLGALSLVGPAFPATLRVFLLSLAVVDDIGALLAIAVFYSDAVSVPALVVAAGCVLVLLALARLAVWRGPAYLGVGAVLWMAMVESGLHPTLGGVVVGLLISAYPPRPEEVARAGALARAFGQAPVPALARSAKLSVERAVSPNERLQELLHPWTSFVIVPVFALANAGVVIDADLVERALASSVTHGVIAGLVIGKLAGIGVTCALAVRLGLGRLPGRLRQGELWGGAALAGIGFTISLFVVDLAFTSPALQDEARLGVLVASALAVASGAAIFALDRRIAGEDSGPVVALATPVAPEVDHIRGPVDAPLTLVEYGDYECPFCGRATGTVAALEDQFGDDLRYVFRHLPLPDVHPRAELAAEAAEAAAAQDAFWPMHERLFAHQDLLAPTDLLDHAAALGLDLERFAHDLGIGAHSARVREHVRGAEASGAEGTPTFFVNGRRQTGRYDAAALARALAAGLPPEAPRRVTAAATEASDARAFPTLGHVGDRGVVHVELDELAETPDRGAFPRLTREQIAALDRHGVRRRVEAGHPLFAPGEPGADFVVVLAGAIAILAGDGPGRRAIALHREGRFLGELSLLRGGRSPVTPVAQRPSEVLVVPGDRLDAALGDDPQLRELVLRTYLLRRAMLLGLAADLRIVGSAASERARALRTRAGGLGLTHVWLDLEGDERATTLLEQLGLASEDAPWAITRAGEVLRDPSEEALRRATAPAVRDEDG